MKLVMPNFVTDYGFFQHSDWTMELCFNPPTNDTQPPLSFKLHHFKYLLFKHLPMGLLVAGFILLVERIGKQGEANKRLFRHANRRIARRAPIVAKKR